MSNRGMSALESMTIDNWINLMLMTITLGIILKIYKMYRGFVLEGDATGVVVVRLSAVIGIILFVIANAVNILGYFGII